MARVRSGTTLSPIRYVRSSRGNQLRPRLRPDRLGNAEMQRAGRNAGETAAAPTTFGLAPRYWRKKLLDAATAPSNDDEPAAGEADPTDAIAVPPSHRLGEQTPELRHVVIDVADVEYRHRHARDRLEIFIAMVALATILLVAASLP